MAVNVADNQPVTVQGVMNESQSSVNIGTQALCQDLYKLHDNMAGDTKTMQVNKIKEYNLAGDLIREVENSVQTQLNAR